MFIEISKDELQNGDFVQMDREQDLFGRIVKEELGLLRVESYSTF